MNKNLELIRQKIEAIRFGLLRLTEGPEPLTMQVSALVENGPRLNCVITDGEKKNSLLNRQVSFIQKNGEDYLYISGKVDDEVDTTKKTISMRILKASWFTRKKKGSAVWLQQKCTYETPDIDLGKAS